MCDLESNLLKSSKDLKTLHPILLYHIIKFGKNS